MKIGSDKNVNIENLFLSDKFKNILKKILEKGDSEISKALLSLDNDKEQFFGVTYIDRTDRDDFITYSQVTRLNRAKNEKEDLDPWNFPGREETRIGRIIRRIFGTKFDQKSVEIFVNKYKAIIRLENQFGNFDVVKGDDIKHWYSHKSYNERRGTLGGSCMQGDECQKYFKIYTKNENQVRLCILKNDKGDKIKGRAIVWNLTKPKGMIFMDRIYSNDDADIMLFIEYAKQNGWYCKKTQTYRGDDLLYPNGEILKDQKLEVELDDNDFTKYPYLDTMRYYYYEEGVLSNIYNEDKSVKTLNDTGGYYEEFDGDYEPVFVTDWRGNEINENDAVWCEDDDAYCLNRESIRVSKGENGRGRFFIPNSPNLKFSDYSDSYYHKDDVIYSEYLKDWIYKKYAVKMYLDKDKNDWIWTHKLTLHNNMGKIDSDYFINTILYRDRDIIDGKLTLGDYHFIDEDFEKSNKLDFDEFDEDDIPDDI